MCFVISDSEAIQQCYLGITQKVLNCCSITRKDHKNLVFNSYVQCGATSATNTRQLCQQLYIYVSVTYLCSTKPNSKCPILGVTTYKLEVGNKIITFIKCHRDYLLCCLYIHLERFIELPNSVTFQPRKPSSATMLTTYVNKYTGIQHKDINKA